VGASRPGGREAQGASPLRNEQNLCKLPIVYSSKVDKIPRVRVPAVRYALLYILASNMHTTSYWPRNWPLRRLRPFSPFPTKGATKSAPQTPQGVRGVGRLSRVDRRFFNGVSLQSRRVTTRQLNSRGNVLCCRDSNSRDLNNRQRANNGHPVIYPAGRTGRALVRHRFS
jgi:hypothetical protein